MNMRRSSHRGTHKIFWHAGRARIPQSVALVSLFVLGGAWAAPTLDDYAQGIDIETSTTQPLIEVLLPDEIYRATTRTDLGDLRVFNAEGVTVTHSFCSAPEAAEPTVTELSLPVFQLREATSADGSSRIDVQTASGTQVRVEQGAVEPSRTSKPSVHIIDARESEAALRAVQFDWDSPDGASEARVRLQVSEDLDRWTTVVAASTLLQATEQDQQLRRKRIELPLRAYSYLRIERIDGGPPLAIRSVIAERVAAGEEIEPLWFSAERTATTEAHILNFDAQRLAPLRYARLRLAQDNTAVRAVLQSRAEESLPWQERWSGESYLIVSNDERRHSPPARFAVTSDRYWRVQLPKQSQLEPSPMLELAYRPARLRFLAQGPAPYMLAFGSRRAEPFRAAACDSLLADVPAEERAQLIAQGFPGTARTLAGDVALTPLPQKTPTRVVVLWAVLIIGAGGLIAMALSLLKRLKPAG